MDFDSLQEDAPAQTPAAPQAQPQQQMQFDDLKPDAPSQNVATTSFDDLQSDDDKYSSPLQQAGNIAEGVAQGIAGPVATLAEKGLNKLGVPGFSDQEILGRQNANPVEHAAAETAGFVGSMLSGVGEAAIIGKGLSKIPQGTTALAKIGSAALKGMLGMGLIEGGDEYSKSILGQGNPMDVAAAHIAKAGGLGLLTGGVFGVGGLGANKALSAIEGAKLGTKLTNFLAGFGHSASFPGIAASEIPEAQALAQMAAVPEDVASNGHSFKLGQKVFTESVPKISQRVGEVAGFKLGGTTGAWASDKLGIGKAIDKLLSGPINSVSKKYLGPMVLKAASSGSVDKLGELLDYAGSVGNGAQSIGKGVDSLFKSGANDALDFSFSEKNREKLRDFIEKGGINKEITDEAQDQGVPEQGYAKGGKVESQPPQQESAVATHFPEQNVLINSAKARVSNYLNSVRPTNNPSKLPFDTKYKDPQAEREYNKALDLANQPLSILKHINDGTLLPKHMKAFISMYPELHQHLSSKITERLTKGQVNDEKKPPYHVRQAMSLFLGAPLASTLTPAGIQAAQGVFAQQANQKQQAAGSKTALSKIGSNTMTADQARTQRLNKG